MIIIYIYTFSTIMTLSGLFIPIGINVISIGQYCICIKSSFKDNRQVIKLPNGDYRYIYDLAIRHSDAIPCIRYIEYKDKYIDYEFTVCNHNHGVPINYEYDFTNMSLYTNCTYCQYAIPEPIKINFKSYFGSIKGRELLKYIPMGLNEIVMGNKIFMIDILPCGKISITTNTKVDMSIDNLVFVFNNNNVYINGKRLQLCEMTHAIDPFNFKIVIDDSYELYIKNIRSEY